MLISRKVALFGLVALVAYVGMGSTVCGPGQRPEPLRPGAADIELAPRWSADGQIIVVAIDDVIYGTDLSGTQQWRIPRTPDGRQYSPNVSSDGWVAYTEVRHTNSGDVAQLKKARIDGSRNRTLRDGRHIPVWSPDGSRIALGRSNSMTTVNSKGRSPISYSPPTLGDWPYHAAWSRRGIASRSNCLTMAGRPITHLVDHWSRYRRSEVARSCPSFILNT